MNPARRRARSAALVAAAIAGYIAGAQVVAGTGWWQHLWADAWWTAASAIATVACFATARTTIAPHRRAAWRWFGAGAGLWVIGILIWSGNELGGGWLTPFPSVADILFDAIAPCFVIACYRYGADRPSLALSVKQAGDLAMIACVLVPVAALALYGPVMETDEDALYVVAALAYPVLHAAALLFGLLCWWQHVWGAWRWVLGLQLGAMAILTVVDTLYAESLLGRRYEAGNAMDWVWVATFLLMTWAAFEERAIARAIGDRDVAEPPVDEAAAADALVPALSVLIAVAAALAFRDRWRGPMIAVGGIAGLGLAVAIGVRLAAGQRLERELRERVRADGERARRLETELVHAQRLQAIGSLAGGVAHDFRNLLQIMTAGLAIAQQRIAAGQPATAPLDEVERAMWRATDLSGRLLDLSRRGSSRVATVDPHRIAEGTAALLAKALPPGIELSVAPAAPTAITVDVAGLEHALINLALNARDAMKGRTGRIRISVATGDVPGIAGRAVLVRVDDDGPGIPPDALPRLFEPFFTTKPPGEGTGLGLAMVERLAAEYGGRVRASNRRDGGARFELAFPAVTAAEVASEAPPPATGATALVVFADEARRLMVRGALERAGFRVEIAPDRDAAIAAARGDPAAIAVMVADAGSGLAGAEASAALRDTGCTAPVVVVSETGNPDALVTSVRSALRAA